MNFKTLILAQQKDSLIKRYSTHLASNQQGNVSDNPRTLVYLDELYDDDYDPKTLNFVFSDFSPDDYIATQYITELQPRFYPSINQIRQAYIVERINKIAESMFLTPMFVPYITCIGVTTQKAVYNTTIEKIKKVISALSEYENRVYGEDYIKDRRYWSNKRIQDISNTVKLIDPDLDGVLSQTIYTDSNQIDISFYDHFFPYLQYFPNLKKSIEDIRQLTGFQEGMGIISLSGNKINSYSTVKFCFNGISNLKNNKFTLKDYTESDIYVRAAVEVLLVNYSNFVSKPVHVNRDRYFFLASKDCNDPHFNEIVSRLEEVNAGDAREESLTDLHLVKTYYDGMSGRDKSNFYKKCKDYIIDQIFALIKTDAPRLRFDLDTDAIDPTHCATYPDLPSDKDIRDYINKNWNKIVIVIYDPENSEDEDD